MNPFQRARTKASEIREQLQPGRSAQPLKASELLSRIEGELNLGVTEVPPDYHDLGSGSAVLDRIQRFIFVSTKYAEGTDTHAGLVAHELGHWFLDPVLSAKTIADYQVVFGSTGSPAALQVEAYGARERQELQANVFAREFLLPRAVATELFQSGKGPRQVSHELGIPLDFAQQQMLDAVLLPEAVDKPVVLHAPSPAQWRAARAPERFANVVAGPGTGKTSTLIHRVKYLVEELKVDPRHILVLTFTNKAAFELVERLRAAGIERASDIWAGTFHAFGLEFLRKYHQRFGLKPSFAVADDLQLMQTLVGGLPRLQLNHYLRVVDPYLWLGKVVRVISRAKEEMLTAQQYRKAIEDFRSEDPEVQARREDIATLFEAHSGLLRQRNSVDFVDLIVEPARAIASDRAQYSELADRFQHILVDEYQDVTKAMVVLLRQLAHHDAKVWVVGDVRQAVHHWRGASLYSLLRFEKQFQSAGEADALIGKYPLDINRRSSDEVLALVQQAGRLHALERRLPLDDVSSAVGKLGVRPVLTHCKEKKQVPGAVVDAIEALAAEGVRLGDQVVLCRKGRDVDEMFAELKTRSIDVIHMGELSRAPEVKLLLCLMQLLVERQPRALIGLASIPALSMPMGDIQLLLTASEQAVALQRGRWLHAPPDGLSPKALQVIHELKGLLAKSTHNTNPWAFVCDLMLEHGVALPAYSDTTVDAAVTRLRLWQFAYAVRNGEGDIRESKLSRFLLRFRLRERVGESYGQRELPPEAAQLDGVRLLTIHGAKGLEFEAVHVFQTDADRFGAQQRKGEWDDNILDLLTPEMLGSTAQDYEYEQTVERNNLLYVALSRAKKHLRMYLDTQFKGSAVAPQLQDPEHYRYIFLEGQIGQGRSAPPAPIVTAPKSVEFSEFRTFYECPLQHWYQNVMRLPREQQYESGIRAQGAIMRVLRTVAAGSGEQPSVLLAAEWADSKLASSAEDPGLWADAQYALERGLAKVAELRAKGGTFCEITSVVGGLRILLPWGFRVQDAYCGSQFHLVLFSRRTYEMTTMFKPIITGLEVAGQRQLVFHSVLSDLVDDGEPAKWVEATNGFAAAVGLLSGRNAPSVGKQCGRCSYATICPSAPQPA